MTGQQTSGAAGDKAAARADFVIVGGGTAGWMAAAALARFAPHKRTILVESDAIGTVGVGEATIPQIHLFNQALGLDEAEFLAATKGSFKLGIEFAGWREPGHSYLHAFGPVGRAHGVVPFHHFWLRARDAGKARPLSAYSANDIAARNNRMGAPGTDFPYAYHFDAGLYAAHLRAYAETRGVTRIEGTVDHVRQSPESGDIAGLDLGDGRSVDGAFFLDCTGFRGLLIEQALGAGYADWSDLLPCDRAVAVPCKSGGDFTPYTRSTAREAGWQWRIPLQHRIGNGYVYSSAHLSDEAAADTLLAHLDGEPLADPRTLKFTTGMRRRHWHRNCLALGLAAGFMEPLESTSIHLVQSAIARFLTLMPDSVSSADTASLASEFNRQAEFEWTRIRDFLVLHYYANGRTGEAFWDERRAATLPDTLAAKLELWRAGARITREHEELFTEVGWTQVLLGQGVMPDSWHPLADALPDDDLERFLEATHRACVKAVEPMPTHHDYLGALLARTTKEVAA
ncbi:tryptophan halogenase family protein [Alteriqipengyuania sp. WL0013]|uniref:tryptophan halogenase family protein n=1 Tax=Alteriqipengyuania sp. WL0013 TaxID=3110773 RepID=UPI002CDE72E5|nr:tryptophan halogenase family protein [Alteriqipengyuania sp. WL0013]MEB3415765.1 tryptophan halogenase family protein [Alteriqipengyuania sp. WL0013]